MDRVIVRRGIMRGNEGIMGIYGVFMVDLWLFWCVYGAFCVLLRCIFYF